MLKHYWNRDFRPSESLFWPVGVNFLTLRAKFLGMAYLEHLKWPIKVIPIPKISVKTFVMDFRLIREVKQEQIRVNLLIGLKGVKVD